MKKNEVIQQIVEIQRGLDHMAVTDVNKIWQELDVPLAQLKNLFIIAAKGETNLSSLAKELGVTRGNVTGIIDRLVEQGLVKRKPNPKDRRTIRLYVTDKGQYLLSGLIKISVTNMPAILQEMKMEDLKAFMKGLAGFSSAVEKYQELN